MIFGILLAILLIIESVFLRVLKLNKRIPKDILLKIHCALGFSISALACIHFAFVLSLWKQRPLFMNITGCVMFAFIIMIAILNIGKKNKLKLTIHKILALSTFVFLGAHIFSGISSLSAYQSAVSNISIDNIDITTISDGVYEGESDVGYIYAKVKVTVLDGKITAIDIIEHRNERGSKAESITDNIISHQSLDVDTITSATNSSKVIKKAVENALKSESK